MTQDSFFSTSYWTQQQAEAERFMSQDKEYVDAMQAKRNHNQILRERILASIDSYAANLPQINLDSHVSRAMLALHISEGIEDKNANN
jgi:uncharacterized protein YqcC (DUF446 family)